MRRFVLLAALLTAASTSGAQVAIREIGLQGYWASAPKPTRVRLELRNDSDQPRSFELQIGVITRINNLPDQVARYVTDVVLQPKARSLADFPVAIGNAAQYIQARLLDRSGRVVSIAQAKLEHSDSRALLALYCRPDELCRRLQSNIRFGGTMQEQVEKEKKLAYLELDDPPGEWWAYEPTHTVIVAAPLQGLSPPQRDALEGFLRSGGNLILCEAEARDPAFLAPYRAGTLAKPQLVGKGRLMRVGSVADPELKRYAGWLPLQDVTDRFTDFLPQRSTLRYLQQRLGTTFSFPALTALLGWLLLYVFLVGVVNFTILRKIGKREWGWISVPVISLLFATALYGWSAAKRPKEVGLDQIGLYWMDDASHLAYGETTLRVSAPDRVRLRTVISGDAVLFDSGPAPPQELSEIFSSERHRDSEIIRIVPGYELDVALYRWSFRDIHFESVKAFSGSVRRDGAELRNETGQPFRDALYVTREKVYFLGPMAAGASVDLASARQQPLASQTGRGDQVYPSEIGRAANTPYIPPDDVLRQREKMRSIPFSLVELIRAWPTDGGNAFSGRSAIFFGLSDAPMLASDLPGIHFGRKYATVTVVSFGAQP